MTWACEFLSIQRDEMLDCAPIARRVELYRAHLRTLELLLYQPLQEGFLDFRCRFLRLDPATGEYREVRASAGGWYRSQELGLEFLLVSDGIAFRDPATGERTDPLVAGELLLDLEREKQRARELEQHVRELESEPSCE